MNRIELFDRENATDLLKKLHVYPMDTDLRYALMDRQLYCKYSDGIWKLRVLLKGGRRNVLG